MPVTADPSGDNTRAQLARVNFMREEPGGRRFFLNDLNGPIYILDKATRQFVTYLDFNGRGERAGLYRRFTFERNFAMGLINVVFDPDYARNGVFYTIHTEDPTTPAPIEPTGRSVPGLDLSAYRTTPAMDTPAQPDGRIRPRSRDCRVDRSRRHQHDLRGQRAGAVAAAAVLADPSARRDDLQPHRPPGRSGLAGDVRRRRRRRAQASDPTCAG